MSNIPFKINYNGEWFYHGSIINRKSIIKLFSSVLLKDNDGTFHLRTPVEDCLVEVEDVPFIVNNFKVLNKKGSQVILFFTNIENKIELGPEHVLWMKKNKETGQLIPYLNIKKGIDARISRSVYYDIANFLERMKFKNEELIGVVSNKLFFPIDRETSIKQKFKL